MRVTIDKVGRVVIPKRIREEVGLTPGCQAEVSVEGTGVRVDPIADLAGFVDDDGFLVIPGPGITLTDDGVRELGVADQA